MCILISYSRQAAAIAPIIGDDLVQRVLRGDDVAEGVVELPTPSSEPVAGPFRIEPIVCNLLVRAIRICYLRNPIQRFHRIAADGVVIDGDHITFGICRGSKPAKTVVSERCDRTRHRADDVLEVTIAIVIISRNLAFCIGDGPDLTRCVVGVSCCLTGGISRGQRQMLSVVCVAGQKLVNTDCLLSNREQIESVRVINDCRNAASWIGHPSHLAEAIVFVLVELSSAVIENASHLGWQA